jgi:threonine/homoserine/homoserine lactone efflux protein
MLDQSDILAYAIALGIAAGVPGPGMTALVARSVNAGALAGFAMLAGLIMGDLIYLSFAGFGLAVLAQSFSLMFVLIKWAAVFYLCYLAWQFWTANTQSLRSKGLGQRKNLLSACLSGITITLANPKTIAFYLALLPVVLDLQAVTVKSWASILIPLTIGVLLVVGGVFILSALAIRRVLSSDKAQQLLHRGAATAMLGAAGSLASREI